MELEEIIGEAGTPVQVVWNRLVKWARQHFELRQGSRNVRFTRTPEGVYVTATFSSPTYAGFFRVSLGNNSVTVGPGTVVEAGNGSFSPYIGQSRADGVQAGGSVGQQPTFPLLTGPSADLESWIVLQCPVVQSTGLFDPKNLAAMQIAHVNTLALPKNGLIAQQEIASIRWSDPSTPAEVFQIVTHNLEHEWVAAAKGGNQGRHWFWGV